MADHDWIDDSLIDDAIMKQAFKSGRQTGKTARGFTAANIIAYLKTSGVTDEELVEKLAALEHKQWAHWTEYMIGAIERELRLLIRDSIVHPNFVKKGWLTCLSEWKRQIKTKYKDLSGGEKESDREWARKVLAVLKGE